MKRQFLLPDPGEGLMEAEIVAWRVAVGDVIEVNDVLVEIETAKSLVELPSPFAGTVTALLVPEMTTVEVGTPIVEIDDPSLTEADEPAAQGGSDGATAEGDDAPTPNLVGYGATDAPASRRRRRHQEQARDTAPASEALSYGLRPARARPPRRRGAPGRAGARQGHGRPAPHAGHRPVGIHARARLRPG